MRSHRFYVPEVIGSRTELSIHSIPTINQIRRVFRLKDGDAVTVFDGSGSDYICRIEGGDKRSLKLAVSETARSRFIMGREVTLFASVVKKDNFEWIVEKATELGVAKVVPVIAERSEKKNLNADRLNKISIEASEQSGRGSIPAIDPIISLKEAVTLVSTRSIPAVIFHTDAEIFNPNDFKDKNHQLAVFTGPEGGWSDDELDMFHANDIPVRSLGSQVLRAETAVVAALSLTLLGK